MVVSSFTILNKDRLIELQQCMKTHMPSARFETNPFELFSGKYQITISYDELNESEHKSLLDLESKWYEIDNPPKPKVMSIWKRILNCIRTEKRIDK